VWKHKREVAHNTTELTQFCCFVIYMILTISILGLQNFIEEILTEQWKYGQFQLYSTFQEQPVVKIIKAIVKVLVYDKISETSQIWKYIPFRHKWNQ